jgi:hypothetical protein
VNPRARRTRPRAIRIPRWPEPAKRAAKLFEDLHWGIAPKKVRQVRKPHAGAALAELGQLEAVEYSTTKKGDGPSVYHHKFGEEGGRRPTLAVDPETRDLHIVGGSYTVEQRGIVD